MSLPPPTIDVEPGPWLASGTPRRLRAVRATLPTRGVTLPPGGLRVVHLSDLHLRRRVPRGLLRVAEMLRRDPADLVLFTGDFADDKFDPTHQLPVVRDALAAFDATATCGMFGVVGNHDGDIMAARLRAFGVTPLHGRMTRATVRGVPVDLLGLPGTFRGEWPGVAKLDREPGVPLVALSHYPDDVLRLRHLTPDLMLAGHTHGGQLRLPGLPPPVTHDDLPRHMAAGVHRVGGTWLSVSQGVGTTRLHLRLFCPPEYGDLRLVRADDAGT